MKVSPPPPSLILCLQLIAFPGINTSINGIPVDPVTQARNLCSVIASSPSFSSHPDSWSKIMYESFETKDWRLVRSDTHCQLSQMFIVNIFLTFPSSASHWPGL